MPQLGGDRVADPTCIGVRSSRPSVPLADDFKRTLDLQNRLCRPLRLFGYFELIVGLLRYGSGLGRNCKISSPTRFVTATVAAVFLPSAATFGFELSAAFAAGGFIAVAGRSVLHRAVTGLGSAGAQRCHATPANRFRLWKLIQRRPLTSVDSIAPVFRASYNFVRPMGTRVVACLGETASGSGEMLLLDIAGLHLIWPECI